MEDKLAPETTSNTDSGYNNPSPEPTAYKSPNLVGYTALGHGTITEEKIIKSPFTPKNIAAGVLIFSLALFSLSYIIPKVLPKKDTASKPPVNVTPPSVVTPPQTSGPGATLTTYTNLEDRFSITHPKYVTDGRSVDDPFPVALELRYNEPLVEIKIGEEKPGWYIRVSKRIDVKSGINLKDFAVSNRLLTSEPVSDVTLADVPAITWHSAIYPQTFYLLDSGEGLVFIKTSIKSQNEAQYRESINSIINTLQFLAKPNVSDPDLGLTWMHRRFGDSWDIDVPDSWKISDEGASNGLIIVIGSYLGNSYQLTFSYPDFTNQADPGIPDSLSSWVLNDLNKLGGDQKALVKTNGLKVSQTQAQEVLNYFQPGSGELTDRLYIWKRNGRNPSRVVINQTSGELDAQKMQTLFERFVAGIH